MSTVSRVIIAGGVVVGLGIAGVGSYVVASKAGLLKSEFDEWQARVHCIPGTAFAGDTTYTCRMTNGCEAVRDMPVLGDITEFERCPQAAVAPAPPAPPPPAPPPRPREPAEPVDRRKAARPWKYAREGVAVAQTASSLEVSYRGHRLFDACAREASRARKLGPGYAQYRVVSVVGPYVGLESASLFASGETVPHESTSIFTVDVRTGQKVALDELFDGEAIRQALLEVLQRDAPYEASLAGKHPTLETVTQLAAQGHALPGLDAFVFEELTRSKLTVHAAKYEMGLTEEVAMSFAPPESLRATLEEGDGFFGADRRDGWTTCGYGPKKKWPKVSP